MARTCTGLMEVQIVSSACQILIARQRSRCVELMKLSQRMTAATLVCIPLAVQAVAHANVMTTVIVMVTQLWIEAPPLA